MSTKTTTNGRERFCANCFETYDRTISWYHFCSEKCEKEFDNFVPLPEHIKPQNKSGTLVRIIGRASCGHLTAVTNISRDTWEEEEHDLLVWMSEHLCKHCEIKEACS